jgi:putative DNA primase/helicase
MNYLVEGYATALSLRAALKHIGVRYTIHVSFSAGNMAKLAKSLTKGMIIADHDPVGEKIARESGWSYFISGKEGEDFNDLHLRVGLESAAAQLRAKLYGF